MLCAFWFSHSSSAEHPGASKPPISSSSMTSRILLRQQLMREQMQEQERREQQQKLQAAQFMQQRVPVSQTPAINVSVPTTLPSATQVPMEVLKVRECCSSGWTEPSSFPFSRCFLLKNVNLYWLCCSVRIIFVSANSTDSYILYTIKEDVN